jgi:hypothetical protein
MVVGSLTTACRVWVPDGRLLELNVMPVPVATPSTYHVPVRDQPAGASGET